MKPRGISDFTDFYQSSYEHEHILLNKSYKIRYKIKIVYFGLLIMGCGHLKTIAKYQLLKHTQTYEYPTAAGSFIGINYWNFLFHFFL